MLLRNTLCALMALLLSLLIAQPVMADQSCSLITDIPAMTKDGLSIRTNVQVLFHQNGTCDNALMKVALFDDLRMMAASYAISELIADETMAEMGLSNILENNQNFSGVKVDIRYHSLPPGVCEELEEICAEQALFAETFRIMDRKEQIENEAAQEKMIQQYAEAVVSWDPNEPKTLEQAKRKIAELEQENQELREQVEYNQQVAGLRIAGVLLICLFIVAGWIIRRLKKGVKDTLDS
jgi:hypothetical protein